MSRGLQFDLNYTFSKSIDQGSNAERVSLFEGNANFAGGFGDQVLNAWDPKQLRAVSDFDTTHQINASWVWAVPVGRRRHFGCGLGRVADALSGGWSLAGLSRSTRDLACG